MALGLAKQSVQRMRQVEERWRFQFPSSMGAMSHIQINVASEWADSACLGQSSGSKERENRKYTHAEKWGKGRRDVRESTTLERIV